MASFLNKLLQGLSQSLTGGRGLQTAAGLGLLGAGTFFDKEPGFAVEARQSLRNLFTNPPSMQFNQPLAPPLQTSSDYLTNLITTPTTPSAALGTSTDYLRGLVASPTDPTAPGGAFRRYLPAIEQQETDVMRRLREAYAAGVPSSIAGVQGAELNQAGQVAARFAQNRQALLADILREQQARQIQGAELLQNVPGIEDIPTGRRLQAAGLLENIPRIQDIYQQNQIRAAEDLLNYAKPNPIAAALGGLGGMLTAAGVLGIGQSDGTTGKTSVWTSLGSALGSAAISAASTAVGKAITHARTNAKGETELGNASGQVLATVLSDGTIINQRTGQSIGKTTPPGTSPDGFPRADLTQPGQYQTGQAAPTGFTQTPFDPRGLLSTLQGLGQVSTSPTGEGAPGGASKLPGLIGSGVGGLVGAKIGAAAAGALGAETGSTILPGIGTVIGALAGWLGGEAFAKSVAGKAQKEFRRASDVRSQGAQEQEIGSFFAAGLKHLGVDSSAYEGFVKDQLSIIEKGPTDFNFQGIAGHQDQQQAVAKVGGTLLLRAIQAKNPNIISLDQVPGLRQAFLNHLLETTLTGAGNKLPVSLIEEFAVPAGLG